MRQWACRSRTNTDDRLPRASFGRAEGGDAIVESCDGADVRPQSSVPHSLDDRTQLGTIGLDNEVDRQAQAAVLEQSLPLALRLNAEMAAHLSFVTSCARLTIHDVASRWRRGRSVPSVLPSPRRHSRSGRA